MRFHSGTIALAALILCTGCATFRTANHKPQQPPASAATQKVPLWKSDNFTGPAAITIALGEQRAYLHKGKELVGISTISSGKKNHETPPGHYRVIQKDMDHRSNIYGEYVDADGNVLQSNVDVNKDPKPEEASFRGAPMRYFLRFTGGYGMHAGYLPGYRASHGCVRMPAAMAKHFYEASEIGTPVTVTE